MKNIFQTAALLLICTVMYAGPARKGTIILRQPDGSTISAIQTGDEFYHVLKDLQGRTLVQDADGYYHEGSTTTYDALLEAKGAEERSLVNQQRALMTLPYRAKAAERAESKVSKKCVVILANFSDTTMRYTQKNFDDVFNKKGNNFEKQKGCVHDYFSAQFGDDWDFEFVVSPIVTLPETQAYYGNNTNDKSYLAVIEACTLADEYIDFSQFDGNNDGNVDNVMLIVAGTDEAESGNTNAIWAHQYYLQYRQKLPFRLDGVRINCYTICSELACRNYSTFRLGTIGTYCHEYGHTLGLADMYDCDGSTGGYSEALNYSTGIMDCGLYNDDSRTPAHYNAIDYDTLGYGDCEELKAGSYRLYPITQAPKYYKVSTPTDGEYYLIECRKNEGWDEFIGGRGLAIYHIDRSNNKVGNISAKGRWSQNSVNNYKAHQCADMIEPATENPSADRAFFPWKNINSFTPITSPSFVFWDGTASSLSITDIKIESDGSVSFNVRSSSELIKPAITNYKQTPFQNSATISFCCSCISDNAYASVIWGENGKEQKEEKIDIDADETFKLDLDNLTPGTEYSIKAQVILSSAFASNIVETTMATYPIDGHGEPYIFMGSIEQNSDGSYKSGTKFPLVVFNTQDAEDIRWYLNDSPIYLGKDGYYTMNKSGVLKASILYSNGQKETLKKQLTVK